MLTIPLNITIPPLAPQPAQAGFAARPQRRGFTRWLARVDGLPVL